MGTVQHVGIGSVAVDNGTPYDAVLLAGGPCLQRGSRTSWRNNSDCKHDFPAPIISRARHRLLNIRSQRLTLYS